MYKRLDAIGGIGGCLGGAVLAYIGYATEQAGTLEIGVAVLVASAIYLLFRNRITSSSNPSLPADKRLSLIVHIIFFSTFAASIYLMHSSLFRPPLYFLLTSICVAVVAVGILSSASKGQTWLLLLEILLIASSLRFGLIYELPGLYGVDAWWHLGFTNDWLGDGHISHIVEGRFTKYADFPVMHLNIMATRIITALDPKDSYYLSIGLFHVISTLFVFMLGQKLVNTKMGLLAALLISIDLFHINWAAMLVPTSLGVGIFIAVVWLIFKGTSNPPHTLILLVISAALVCTHPIAALVTAIASFLFFATDLGYKRLYNTGVEKMNIRLNFIMLFCVLLLASWLYASRSPSVTLFQDVVRWLFAAITVKAGFTGTVFEASATPLGPLNRVGFLMLVGFIAVGSLYWLCPKAISNKKLAIIFGTFGLAVITVVLPGLNIKALLTARWLPYVSILGTVIAAEGVMVLSRLLNGRIMKSLALVLILFIFSMFMVNSHAVNTLTPFYGREHMQDPNRFAFFESELSAVETITEIYDGQVTTDSVYKSLAFDVLAGHERAKYLNIEGEKEGLIAIRKYIYTHPFIKGYDEEYNQLLASFSGSAYNTVYDNGEVKAFLEGPR